MYELDTHDCNSLHIQKVISLIHIHTPKSVSHNHIMNYHINQEINYF